MEAQKTLSDWEKDIKERELAEKRRVAPGWLDRDEKILEPERKDTPDLVAAPDRMHKIYTSSPEKNEKKDADPGTELDLVFGAIGLR